MMTGTIASVNVSEDKGSKKRPVERAVLLTGLGISGDAHAGDRVRQVSLLARESIDKMSALGLSVGPGDFAENLTCSGLDLTALPVGSRLEAGAADQLGNRVILQISQIGKVCHTPCQIGKQAGECIMPREGVFAQVVRGGELSLGDVIKPVSCLVGAVLTVSDRCAGGEREDGSGPVLQQLLRNIGMDIAAYEVVPDEEEIISRQLAFLADSCCVDVVLTTGGTGFSPRDVTPEATAGVVDRTAPGIAEAIRRAGAEFTPYACLSRGTVGLRGRTLIVNLPGSKKAVSEAADFLAQVLPHALKSLRGEAKDCGRAVQL